MSNPFKTNLRLLRKGATEKRVKPKDYDQRVADIENPDEVVRTIKARLRLASAFREMFEEDWRGAFLAWMQILNTEKEDSWESKRYMPVILKHTETALPSITSSVFNGTRIWTVFGKDPVGRDNAAAMESLLEWQARGPSRMESAFDDMAFWSTLFGTGYFDCQWSEKKESMLRPDIFIDLDDEGNEIEDEDGEPSKVKVLVEKEVIVEDWPIVTALNPTYVWSAPYSTAGDNGPWFVMREDTTLNKLKEAAGFGHLDLDAINEWEEEFFGSKKNTSGWGEGNAYTSLFESASANLWNEWLAEVYQEDRGSGDTSDDYHTGDHVIPLLVYRSKTERITIAPGDRIIGYSKNPYMHGKTGIIVHQFIPIPDCPYGRGLGTVLLPHQELSNENINLFMDVAKISLMAPVIVNRGSVSTLDTNFRWTPNKMIHARDVNNAAKRLEVPAPTNLAMLFDGSLDKAADEITGFSEQARGLTPSGVNTATEFSGLQQNIATRAYMHVRRLRRTMSLLGQMLCSLNQQFMTQAQVISVVGEDGLDYRTVKPWEVVGEFDIQATVNQTRSNPQMKAQQMIAATQVIVPLMQQGTNPFVMRWLRTLLEQIGVEDLDRLLPKNIGKVRNAMAENVALERGIVPEPSPLDQHEQHVQVHATRMQELQAAGADEEILAPFMEHIQMHLQMGQTPAGAGGGETPPQGGATPQGGSPERQEAQAMGAAQGSNGVPGAAAPGPQAPAGRPM